MSLTARETDQTGDAAVESAVLNALQGLSLQPDGVDIVTAGQVYAVVSTGGVVRVLLDPQRADEAQQELLSDALAPLLRDLTGVRRVVVKPRPCSHARHQRLPGIGRVIAVHSGKGGVGKSSISAALAMALAGQGQRVGLLDADAYGPSAARLFGIHGRAEQQPGSDRIRPFQAQGVKLMSLAFLVPEDQALAWRGGMISEGLPQLFDEVDWGELDLLLIDMPPGTSDVHLAVCGHVRLDGVITVTAPGETSLDDVRRGMEMFADLAVPCLGVVENMAGLQCVACGNETHLFGHAGGERLAQELGIELLAQIPFEPAVAALCEAGQSVIIAAPQSAMSGAAGALAERIQRLPAQTATGDSA